MMDFERRKIEEHDPEWVVALKRYSRDESKPLRDAMRSGEPLEGAMKELDEGLSEAFEKSSHVAKYNTLWVATSRAFPVKPGEKMTIPLWQSGSSEFGGCRIFGGNYYRVSGAIGLDMGTYSIADQRLHLEFEVLLKKGQTFIAGEPRKEKILTYFYNEDTGRLDEDFFDVEFVPLTCVEESQ